MQLSVFGNRTLASASITSQAMAEECAFSLIIGNIIRCYGANLQALLFLLSCAGFLRRQILRESRHIAHAIAVVFIVLTFVHSDLHSNKIREAVRLRRN